MGIVEVGGDSSAGLVPHLERSRLILAQRRPDSVGGPEQADYQSDERPRSCDHAIVVGVDKMAGGKRHATKRHRYI